MNKELNSPFLNKKTSLCFHIADFKQRQSKKAFAIGALICMSTTAMAAVAAPENAYQGGARALIATSGQPQTSNYHSSQDVNSLREQLLDKTRELQEYKSSLFRASHPQDQAKITELTQRIAEHEKNKQELIAKIQEYENDLLNAKKQMSGLEVSTDALTAFIQSQRALVEAEKNELTAKIRAYEEDPQLEKERKCNEKLLADLEILKSTIAAYEARINDLEYNHQKDLHDALQDAAMLKFELADTRLLAEKKEHEVIVSTLNYVTMAIDHAKTLKTSQVTHKTKLNESEQDLSTLKSVIDEIANENLRLQRENDKLVEQSNGGQAVLDKHFAERHVLANKLLEKEEALSAALLYYQGTLAEQTNQLQSLQEQLAKEEAAKLALINDKDHALSQHDLEKHVLESTVSEHSETMTDVLLTYQLALNDYVAELRTLQERLANEEALKQKILNEKDVLANNHAVEKDVFETTSADHQKAIDNLVNELQALKDQLEKEIAERNRLQAEKDQLSAQFELHTKTTEASLSEKEEENTKKLAEHQKTITEHVNELQALKDRLDQETAERDRLQTEKDQLSTQFDQHTQTAETSLSEKEEEHAKKLAEHQKAITEHLNELEALKNRLDQETAERDRLQAEKDQLSNQLDQLTQTTETSLSEKEKEHARAVQLSQDTIAEHLGQIESLKELLAKEEQARSELQKAHEELTSNHSNTQETIALHQQDKQQLELALQEKEEALKKTLNESQDTVASYMGQIDSLKDKLAIEAESRTALQQAYEQLSSDHSSSKESLETTLKEKEEAYRNDLAASQLSIADCQRQIEDLKEKLTEEEANRKQLQQAHEELSSNHSAIEQKMSQYEAERHGLENTLNEKEEALKSALSSTESSLTEYTFIIEELKSKLASEEANHAQLQQAHGELSSKQSGTEQMLAQHEAEKQSLERRLQEKEEALGQALASFESSTTEYTALIESLKEKISNEEAARLQLQQTNEGLSSTYMDTEQKLSQYEAAKQTLQRALQEKEEEHSSALTSLQSSTAEYNSIIEALKERLANEESSRRQLELSHESLTANNASVQQALSQHIADKQSLESALQEKEASHAQLQQTQHAVYETINEELLNEINALKQNIQALSSKQSEDWQHNRNLEEQLSSLSSQIDQDHEMIDHLKQEISRLTIHVSEKTSKENELEQAIHSLTIVAEHQDHALAEANSAFTMMQEYNHHLEAENYKLKSRLNQLETAERAVKRSSNAQQSSDNDQSFISPALIQLLRPKS